MLLYAIWFARTFVLGVLLFCLLLLFVDCVLLLSGLLGVLFFALSALCWSLVGFNVVWLVSVTYNSNDGLVFSTF